MRRAPISTNALAQGHRGLRMLLAFALAAVASAAPANTLREVRTWSLGDSTRIAIEVDGALQFQYDRLADPPRVFFDLEDTSVGDLRGSASTITVGDPIVRQIRVGILKKGVARVVVDLFELGEFTVSQLTNPSRLVIEVRRGASKPSSPAPEPAAPAIPSTAEPRVPVIPVAAEPITAAPSKAEPTRRSLARQKTSSARNTKVRYFVPPPVERRALVQPQSPPIWTLARQPRASTHMALKQISTPPTWISHVAVRPKRPVLAAALAPPPTAAPAAVLAKSKKKAPAPEPEPLPPPPSVDPAPVAVSVAAKVAPEPSITPLDARPAQQTRLGDRSLTRALGLKLRRVVIDAGHGGHDTGTISRGGLKEKDVVLDVARRLGALIEDRLGSEVIYTRADDTFVPLEDRTAFANRQKADLFISIHGALSASSSAAGMETFYLNFTTSKADLDVAARENASSEKSIHDLSDLVRKITLQDKVEESREFASRIQSAGYELTTKTHGRVRNRGVKKAPFVVLIGARMPSILVEIGFLTNSKEESLMRKGDHRDKIAEALFKGVDRYAEGLSHFRVAQTSSARGASEAQ